MKPLFLSKPLRKEARNAASAFASPGVIDSNWVSGRPNVLLASNGPIPIVRWAYYAFIFSLPFEAIDMGFGHGHFTLSKMVGYIFLMSTLLQPSLCYRPPPKAFWYFIAYLHVVVILGILVDTYYLRMLLAHLLSLVQLLVLFWLSYNLMHDEKTVKGTLLNLAIACTVLAVLQVLGITAMDVGKERLSAFGENPNTFSAVLSIGLLALVGLAYGREEIDTKSRLLAWAGFFFLAITIIESGSRGSLVALGVGLTAFLLKGENVWAKLKVGLIVLLALSSLVWLSYQSEATRARWEKTLNEGSMASREKIFPAAWAMFLEKPLVGWGPERNYAELGSRLGVPSKDTHNLYLHVLTESGLLGALPFFIALWLCWRAAWKARDGTQGILPMAMLLCVLVINMKGTWHNRKLFWIVLAYALASSSYVVRPGFRLKPLRRHLDS